MASPQTDIENLLRYADGAGDEDFAKGGLDEALAAYTGNRRESLAKASFDIDGMEYSSLYQPMDYFDDVEELRVRFFEPDIKKKWDFNRPTMDLSLHAKGKARSRSFAYNPERLDNWERPAPLETEEAMYSIFVTQGYRPTSLKEASERLHEVAFSLVSPAYKLDAFWRAVRTGKVIPFELRVCVYTRTERRMYDLDLVRNKLVGDFRNGKVKPGAARMPPPLQCMYFDRIHASLDIPELNKNIFTLLFHSDGITPQEVAVVLGISSQMALNHLKGLQDRGLARTEGKKGQIFYANVGEYERISKDLTPS